VECERLIVGVEIRVNKWDHDHDSEIEDGVSSSRFYA